MSSYNVSGVYKAGLYCLTERRRQYTQRGYRLHAATDQTVTLAFVTV